jgi:hypothetical protein
MVLPPAQNFYIGCGATIAPKGLLLWMSDVIYSKISIYNIISIDSQTKEKISLAPTPFSDETSLLYNIWPSPPSPLTSLLLLIGRRPLFRPYRCFPLRHSRTLNG